MNKGKIIVGVLLIIALIIGGWWFWGQKKTVNTSQNVVSTLGTSNNAKDNTTLDTAARNNIIQNIANYLINYGDLGTDDGKKVFLTSYNTIVGQLDAWDKVEDAETWKAKITSYKNALGTIKKGIETKDDVMVLEGSGVLAELKQLAAEALR